ncbi:family 43 glycosylhydrolase [Bacteroides sp.]
MRHFTYSFLLAAALTGTIGSTTAQAANTKITPGTVWNDASGQHINAHGCCVIFHEGTYYWFGEDRNGYDSNGVSCYTSADLYNWKRVGLVFNEKQARDPETGKCILERPKVMYNDKTQKWVMYIHWEDGTGYGKARVCVAVSDRIDGAYEFVSTFRPNDHDSRDQTIFKDTDGRAYHFCSTDMNSNMNVALLSEDYLETEKNPVTETKILKGLKYEAPAIFKVGDIYYGLFSGCTGWSPNPGHSASATDILGTWTAGGNFAIDMGNETTYKSQSTFVLKVNGYENAYIYMGDRWNSNNVSSSDYVWLPLSVRSGAPTVKWYDSWDMSVFENADRFKRIKTLSDGAVVRILEKYSDRWMSKPKNGFNIDEDNDDVNLSFELKATDNPYIWKLKEVNTGNYLESVFGSIRLSAENAKSSQQWRLELEEDGCYKIQNADDKKLLSVSGSSTLQGSNLFLAKEGASSAQSFGFYFDTEAYDYEAADMFSRTYREENKKQMKEQAAYESGLTGIGGVKAKESAFLLYPTVNEGDFTVETDNGTVRMQMTEIGSGRLAYAAEWISEGEPVAIRLNGILADGIYAVRVQTTESASVKRMLVHKK